MLEFYVKIRIRFSLRDKRLFEITEIEITRVDCIYLKTKVLHGPGFCCGLGIALLHVRLKNLNTDTEKSEQTVFAQISQSQY